MSPETCSICPCSCLMARVPCWLWRHWWRQQCFQVLPHGLAMFTRLPFCPAARLQGERPVHGMGPVICGPWVPGRSRPLSRVSPGSGGQLLLTSTACPWWASAGSSPCTTAVTLDTVCYIWKSASVCLGSGFQFSVPRRCWNADGSLSCPRKQTVFTKQVWNN